MRTSCNAFSSNTCFILFHFVASVSASSPHRFTRTASSARANATANARTHASVTPTHEPRLPPLQQCYQSPHQTFQLSIQAGSASSIAKHAPLTNGHVRPAAGAFVPQLSSQPTPQFCYFKNIFDSHIALALWRARSSYTAAQLRYIRLSRPATSQAASLPPCLGTRTVAFLGSRSCNTATSPTGMSSTRPFKRQAAATPTLACRLAMQELRPCRRARATRLPHCFQRNTGILCTLCGYLSIH